MLTLFVYGNITYGKRQIIKAATIRFIQISRHLCELDMETLQLLFHNHNQLCCVLICLLICLIRLVSTVTEKVCLTCFDIQFNALLSEKNNGSYKNTGFVLHLQFPSLDSQNAVRLWQSFQKKCIKCIKSISF